MPKTAHPSPHSPGALTGRGVAAELVADHWSAPGKASLEDNSAYTLERIRAMLLDGNLGQDGKLPTERALSQSLKVGRRSVRRALEVLEAEGRIWRRQGAGTFAGPAPVADQQALDKLAAQSNFMEVMEVRLRVEPQLAELAAMRAQPADIIGLRDLLSHIGASQDADSRELWDSAFHRKIAECAGNRLYLALFEMIDRVRQEAAWIDIREQARSPKNLSLYADQHEAIIDAIATRNPDRAFEAMRTHLASLQENLVRLAAKGGLDAV